MDEHWKAVMDEFFGERQWTGEQTVDRETSAEFLQATMPNCPKCGSTEVWAGPIVIRRFGGYQSARCKSCRVRVSISHTTYVDAMGTVRLCP